MASKPKASATAAATEAEELPPLQPVLMKAAEESESESEDKENEMVTPKSENCILKQPTVCPPAPRKREPVRRKPLGELSPNGFYTVPQDLSSAFTKRPNGSPPKKRIRLL